MGYQELAARIGEGMGTMATSQERRAEALLKILPMECPVCDRRFRKRVRFEAHCRKAHQGKK